MSARLSFRCLESLVELVDEARGDVPRERWLRRAVEQALSEAKEPVAIEQADPGFRSLQPEGVRSAAPAEPLVVKSQRSPVSRQHSPTCQCAMCK